MSNDYSREILRRVVAQVCQIIGWQGINSTPLDILVHILEKYILTLCTQTHRYAEQFNRTEPNLHDLGLVFRDVHIPLQELREYTRGVPPVPCQLNVPNFPLPKESHLNFLKPGSQEVVTRHVSVHEYLPAMHPDKETTPAIADTIEITHNGIEDHGVMQDGAQSPEISVTDDFDKNKDVFKRPTDPVSFTPPGVKRPRLKMEEEDSRTREISSVMMTMSGFLSPAREGKLPEARTPVMIHHHSDKPKPNLHQNTTTPHHPNHPIVAHKPEHSEKKSKKNKSLNGKVEKVKKKDKSHKNMVPGKQKNSENRINKLAMHLARGKVRPSSSVKHHTSEMPPLKQLPPSIENNMKQIKQEIDDTSHNKHLPPMHPHHTTHTPPPHPQLLRNPAAFAEHSHHKNSHAHNLPPPPPPVVIKEERMDDEKLTSQPDRSKLNIFKKISSKIKEEKNPLPNQDRHGILDHGASDKMNHSIPASGGSSHDKELYRQKMHHVKEVIDSVVSNSIVDLSSRKSHSSSEIVNNSAGVIIKQEIVDDIPKDLSKPRLMSPHNMKAGHVKEKKERKHKEKKPKPDKALKQMTKMMRKKQMAEEQLKQLESQEMMGMRLPPPFLFPGLLPNQGLLSPGLLPPGPGLIPSGGLFSAINNPVLRGMLPPDPSNMLPNPFALGPGGSGGFSQSDLFPGPGLIPSNLSNPLISHMAHSFGKPPPLPSFLRRPSLEVIPIEENHHSSSKQYISPPLVMKERDKSDKVKMSHTNSLNINNNTTISTTPIKPSPPKVNSSMKMQHNIKPDVTIKMNVNIPEKHKSIDLPKPEVIPPPPPSEPPPVLIKEKDKDKTEKKKDKLHKKEKKDKEMKIKKKKNKKDKLKIKIEKKKEKVERQEMKVKEERQELKERKKEKKEKRKEKEKEKEKEKLTTLPEGLVPKLTLKLGSSSPMPPSSPETTRKLNIKPILKKDEPSPLVEPPSFACEEKLPPERAHSPELARISALVTRPPKIKSNKHNSSSKSETSSDLNSSLSPPPQQSSTSPHRKNKSSSSYSRYKRIYFKPIPKKGSMDEPGIDEDLPLPSPSVSIPEKNPNITLGMPFYMDSQGNKVWICPACGQQDNGSPMIGCDGGCDGWYHWECVGIRVAPDDNEDWYCMACKAKRAAMASALAAGQTRKKRGRKPKAEKLKEIH